MKLLSPSDIIRDRSESAEESRDRSKALATEESRLARAINQARADAKAEMEIIEEDYRAYREEKEAERAELQRQVESLKNERAELLKPVDHIKAEAEARLRLVEDEIIRVNKILDSVMEQKEKNADRADELVDLAEHLDEREEHLDQRQRAVSDEESRVKHSLEELGQKWAELHNATHALNAKIAKHATIVAEVAASAKANEIRATALRQRDADLSAKALAIEDGYRNLAAARKELLGRDE